MWTEVRNNSRSQLDEAQDHNITQIISPAFSWLPSSSERNGSTTASPPARDESRVHSTSGIIPGAIAAAVFIGFLLALYTVLWKCMVTQPKSYPSGSFSVGLIHRPYPRRPGGSYNLGNGHRLKSVGHEDATWHVQ